MCRAGSYLVSKEARTPTGRLAARAVVLLVGGQRAALPAMIGPSSLRAVMMTESRGNGELTSWTYASYRYRVYLLPLSILLSSFCCYLFLVDRVPIESIECQDDRNSGFLIRTIERLPSLNCRGQYCTCFRPARRDPPLGLSSPPVGTCQRRSFSAQRCFRWSKELGLHLVAELAIWTAP